MEEMKNNVYKDVLYELRMFYCVDTNSTQRGQSPLCTISNE